MKNRLQKSTPLYIALAIAGILIVLFIVWRMVPQSTPQNPARKPETGQQGQLYTPPKEDVADRLREYIGKEPELKVYINQSGETETMPFEQYLVGVVAGEVGPEAPPAAMEAQAILARTFTLDQVTSEANPCSQFQAMVCTDPESFQAYAPEKINDRVRQAVENTRGQVLLYRGDVIYALYSAHAGGQTATKEESFPHLERDLPYLRSVQSPDDDYAEDHIDRWQLTMSVEEFAEKLRVDPGKLTQVRIADKGPSGRTLRIDFGGVTLPATEVRKRIGPNEFRSTLLTNATLEGGRISFAGKGWGHGAGLSQWGAITMAREGRSAAEILKRYYPTSGLARLWR